MGHEAHHDGGRVGELQIDLLRDKQWCGARVELDCVPSPAGAARADRAIEKRRLHPSQCGYGLSLPRMDRVAGDCAA